jgi:hypothetical protein
VLYIYAQYFSHLEHYFKNWNIAFITLCQYTTIKLEGKYMKTIKKITAITLMLALVVGCFAAMPLTVSAMPYSDDFDATATYTAGAKDTGSCVWSSGGVVYQFYVMDGTGKEFYSLCASDIGDQIGVNAEYEADTISKKDQIVAALNYINNEYDSLNTWSGYQGGLNDPNPEANTKLISQLVVWAIINDKDPYTLTGAAWGFDYDPSLVNSAVSNVFENYVGATGDIDIVYLASSFITESNMPSQPQIVPIVKPETPDGGIKLLKTVDGVRFDIWCKGYDVSPADLLKDITFELHRAASKDGSTAPTGTTGTLDSTTGIITFAFNFADDIHNRGGLTWYAVVERFTTGSLAEEIFAKADTLYFELSTTGTSGTDFDYNAFYTIVNGYSTRYIKNLDYPGLDQRGNIFYIGVTNTDTLDVYASFCAHADSKRFAGDNDLGTCTGYVVPATFAKLAEDIKGGATYDDFLAAYNYIEDEYGNLNTNRVITQVVTWVLLGAIDISSSDFANAKLTTAERDAVVDVIGNYKEGFKGSTGSEKIVDLVYMICANPEHDFEYCQPQLVPIYGNRLNNRLNDPETGSLTVCAKAVLKTSKETILKKLQCEFTPWEEWTQYVSPSYSSVTATNANYKSALTFDSKNNPQGINVVTNSNHFTYAKLSRAALLAEGGVDLALVVGNTVDKVGTGNAAIVDGKLVLTFDNIYGKAGYGAVAFNGFMPVVKNGNIHSVGIFSANSKNVIDIYSIGSFQSTDKKGANYDKDWAEITKNMKDSDEFVYLYVHFGNVQFDKGKEMTDSGKDKVVHRSEEVTKTTVTKSKLTVDFVVYDSEGNVVAEADFGALKPGMYTVVYDDGKSAPTSKTVEVKAGETAKSTYFKKYFETAEPEIIKERLPTIVNPVVIKTTVTTVK